MDDCSVFPHGRRSVYVLLASILAYVLASQSSGTCYYMQVDFLDGPLVSFNSVWVGPGGHNRGSDYCDLWSQTERDFYFDDTLNAAFGMASAANITAFICAIGSCVLSCVVCNISCVKSFGVASFIEAVLGLLGLVSLTSDFCDRYNCTFGIGAGLTIPAAIVACIAGWLYLTTPPYQAEGMITVAAPAAPAMDAPPGSVQVVQETLPDGTKKTIRTTVNADGSKTVEETIETPV